MRAGVGRAPGWERRMKARGHWFGLGGMAGLLVGGAAMTAPRGGETFEARVLAEINAARTDPADYAARLRVADGAVGGDDGWSREDRAYDAAARQEAIDFLSHQRPLSALSPSAGLGAAAEQLARQQALDGQVGHASALRERIEGYRVWSGVVAETISYGMTTPAAVVQQLVIDEGVPGRGHRGVLFDQTLNVAGVGCGPHPTYRFMCVIDFAGAVIRR